MKVEHSIWEQKFFTVNYQGTTYTFDKLEKDISDHWGKPEGTIFLDYRIGGLDIPFYMVTDLENCTFGFAYKVIEDDKNSGLFVTLQDAEVHDKLSNLVSYVDHMGGEK